MAESAVVGYPCNDKGEGIYAYVTLKDGFLAGVKMETELRGIVRQKIAAYAVPDVIQVAKRKYRINRDFHRVPKAYFLIIVVTDLCWFTQDKIGQDHASNST